MTDSVPKDETAPTPPATTDEKASAQNWVNWTREHRLSFWSNVASFLNAGFAAFAFLILILTLQATQDSLSAAQRSVEEARRQADAAIEQVKIAKDGLIASDRPWLQIANFEVVRIGFDGNYVTVWTKFVLKNVGHSPALAIEFTPEISAVDAGNGDMTAGLSTVCSRAKAKTLNSGIAESIVFPGEEVTTDEHIGLFVATIARVQASLAGSSFSDEISLNGCATYKGPTNATVYSTSFGGAFSKKCAPKVYRCQFSMKGASIVFPNEINQRQPFSGRTAD